MGSAPYRSRRSPDWTLLLADDARSATALYEHPAAGLLRAAVGLTPPGMPAGTWPLSLSPAALAAGLRRRLPRGWSVGVADEAYVVVADGAVAVAVVGDNTAALRVRRDQPEVAARLTQVVAELAAARGPARRPRRRRGPHCCRRPRCSRATCRRSAGRCPTWCPKA